MRRQIQIRELRISHVIRSAVVVIVFAMPATGQEQRYTVLNITQPNMVENHAYHKAVKRTKQTVLNSGNGYAANQAKIREWYELYFFRSFTLPNELPNLPAKRRDLLTDLKKSERIPALRAYLIAQTKTYMQGFATSKSKNGNLNIHPAVRFNAMLVMGELNTVEQVRGKMPVADPQALEFMLDQFNSPEQIDPVRFAALVGILRHAKVSWGTNQMGQAKKRVADTMIKLAKDKNVPDSRHPAAHVWMRRRAVDILSALGLVGTWDPANQVIDQLVSDSEEDIHLRCTAASAYGWLVEGGQKKPDLAVTSTKLGALAAAIGRSELDWIGEYKRRKAAEAATPGAGDLVTSSTGKALDTSSAEDMMGVDVAYVDPTLDESTGFDALSGGSDSLTGDAATDMEIKLVRRRFLTKLVCVKKGLDAFRDAANAAAPPEKARIDRVISRFDSLLAATKPPEDDLSVDGIARNVKKAVVDLERLTDKATARAVPVGASTVVPNAVPTGS